MYTFSLYTRLGAQRPLVTLFPALWKELTRFDRIREGVVFAPEWCLHPAARVLEGETPTMSGSVAPSV